MSNRSRKLIFLVLLVAFFIIGVPVVLYSYGYRIDIEKYSVSESGGIFLRSIPGDASIKVNGKEVKNESGIFNAGTFIKSLSPKKYSVLISKDGYYPISFTTTVLPFKADSFDKLILVPIETILAIPGAFTDFIVESDTIVTTNDIGQIKLKNEVIPGQKPLSFTADRKSLLVESEAPGIYLLVNLAKPKSTLNINEIFWNLKNSKLRLPGETPIKLISPHPYEPNKFIISTRSALYLLDIKQLSISMIGDGVDDLSISGSSVALIKKGESALYNFTIRTLSPLISVAGSKKVVFSKDGSKMAILWPRNILEIYDIKEKKSLRFNIENILPSGRMEWFKDENHLFIDGQAGIYFLETDYEVFKPELIIPGSNLFKYDNASLYFITSGGIRQLKF